jgi:hypothetical protein
LAGGNLAPSSRLIADENPQTGEKIIETLVHQDIFITSDEYTNALLVLAPASNIDMMEMWSGCSTIGAETLTVR